jgi:hypothetical protein
VSQWFKICVHWLSISQPQPGSLLSTFPISNFSLPAFPISALAFDFCIFPASPRPPVVKPSASRANIAPCFVQAKIAKTACVHGHFVISWTRVIVPPVISMKSNFRACGPGPPATGASYIRHLASRIPQSALRIPHSSVAGCCHPVAENVATLIPDYQRCNGCCHFSNFIYDLPTDH